MVSLLPESSAGLLSYLKLTCTEALSLLQVSNLYYPPEVVVNSRETEGFEFFAHSRKQEGKTIEKPHARTQKPDLWKRSSSDVWLSKSGDGLI